MPASGGAYEHGGFAFECDDGEVDEVPSLAVLRGRGVERREDEALEAGGVWCRGHVDRQRREVDQRCAGKVFKERVGVLGLFKLDLGRSGTGLSGSFTARLYLLGRGRRPGIPIGLAQGAIPNPLEDGRTRRDANRRKRPIPLARRLHILAQPQDALPRVLFRVRLPLDDEDSGFILPFLPVKMGKHLSNLQPIAQSFPLPNLGAFLANTDQLSASVFLCGRALKAQRVGPKPVPARPFGEDRADILYVFRRLRMDDECRWGRVLSVCRFGQGLRVAGRGEADGDGFYCGELLALVVGLVGDSHSMTCSSSSCPCSACSLAGATCACSVG